MAASEAGAFYRNQWYWGGEARLRAEGDKLQLRSIPAEEWNQVADAAAVFWDEVAEEGELEAQLVGIFKQYREVINSAGYPYSLG